MARIISSLAILASMSADLMEVRADGSLSPPSKERWSSGFHLGVDYYPSHWQEEMWETDVARMRDTNLTYVRISEFDWTLLEPEEGNYNFTILDQTIELLGRHNLKAIIGTPTAAPPNWICEKYDIYPVDVYNDTLHFGSRRHYSFSSFNYRRLSQNITEALAKRYGNNSIVAGWQLDNEFGGARSFDQNAMKRFRTWLEAKYNTIENLNERQGRVFWSSQYTSFETVMPPFLEVYMNNQAHKLDWYRFSSDMVIDFAKEQASILRKYAPNQAVTTNFMNMFTEFDHHKFSREVGLDFATWDNYPLAGLTSFSWVTEQEQADYLRTGLPDLQAMNHALYRGIAGAAYDKPSGPFGVMESQPGLVNWSPYRVSPLDGMVRLWTHEVFAESGDFVSYFRWRQVPYAQEQTLSGLFVSDNSPDRGYLEVQAVASQDLEKLREAEGTIGQDQGDVALIFDYTADWVWEIEPHSGGWDNKKSQYEGAVINYKDIVYSFYLAIRRLGLSVDIISAHQPIDGYKMVVVPSLPIIPDAFNSALSNYSGPVVFGPNSGSTSADFSYALGLNPSNGTLRERLPMRVTRIETTPSYAGSSVSYAGSTFNISSWEEWISCERDNRMSKATVSYSSAFRKGKPAACSKDGAHYLAFNPPPDFLVSYLGDVAADANIKALTGKPASKDGDLGPTIRLAKRGNLIWVFNYGLESVEPPKIEGAKLLIGDRDVIHPADLAVYKL
ncbi:uncharacterized protein N7446_003711 [Penicillium canescens]|uniref:beta-galactosidase n=1 Tax=Penicillium canescens TaxID=5083 RepID=A0AAD6I3J9_PENCN|nr:uncharacterized protein N7446_003711 [Penicillium canescens]KAJ6027693.1 hypothetical protein N7460_012510 [Penicillium canescens]KAJ6040973.1 hypothetical protein N7444_009878 [Penicillium canescens]KAJ6066674.1 hypothetical protein N7446_003711 [Penicillium canescens]